MHCYASRTGTKRNLDLLRQHGWGLMISRAGKWRLEGFTNIVADNGAWSDYQQGKPFDEEKYDRFLDWLEAQAPSVIPAWCVLPDVVAGGRASLALSLRYLNRCLSVSPLALIAVQDGLVAEDVETLVGPSVGIFLGGSTEWKLSQMRYWGEFCAAHRCHYHVARVNTAKRMFNAIHAGADSIDGSGPSRYATQTSMLTYASQHQDLFPPRREQCQSNPNDGKTRFPIIRSRSDSAPNASGASD